MVKTLLSFLLIISFSVAKGATFVVTDTTDGTTTDGVSLRWAITQANNASSHDTIAFNIAGMAPHTVLLNSALPDIYDSYLFIDGTSQPPNGYTGTDLKIIISNADTIQDGLYFFVPYNALVKGVQISNFLDAGIYAFGSSVFFTVDSCKLSANNDGVSIFGSVAHALVQNSELSGNLHDGVYVFGANAYAVIEHNLISGNGHNGITINGGSDSTTIQGNRIGTDSSGTLPFPNMMNGILIQNNHDLIGGMNSGDGNIIAYNGADGVQIPYGSYNLITQNSFFCNAGLGINLGSGGNNNFPAPVITSATIDSAKGTATVSSRIELYYDSSCTSCQGKTYIATVFTDTTGMWMYTGSLLPNSSITATATDSTNNTSKFSACVAIITTSVSVNSIPSIHLFPNPASDLFTVQYPNHIFDLTMSDLAGRIVYRSADNYGKAEINSSGFANGIYIVRVREGNAMHYSKITVAR